MACASNETLDARASFAVVIFLVKVKGFHGLVFNPPINTKTDAIGVKLVDFTYRH